MAAVNPRCQINGSVHLLQPAAASEGADRDPPWPHYDGHTTSRRPDGPAGPAERLDATALRTLFGASSLGHSQLNDAGLLESHGTRTVARANGAPQRDCCHRQQSERDCQLQRVRVTCGVYGLCARLLFVSFLEFVQYYGEQLRNQRE